MGGWGGGRFLTEGVLKLGLGLGRGRAVIRVRSRGRGEMRREVFMVVEFDLFWLG